MQGRRSVGRSVSNVHATGVWVCLIWRATGLLKDLHTWAEPWRWMQCGDERRVGLFLASTQTQKAEGRRKPLGEELFVRECRNPLGSSDPLSLELGARIELLEQLRVLAHVVTCSEFVTPSRLELQSGPGRHARLPSLRQWVGRKRLSTPSTTASESARFGITSGSWRLASNPNSLCCSTLVKS